MFSRRSITRMFSFLLAVLLVSGTVSAQPLNAVLGTGFTYQGKLTDAGVPANGLYDFEFKLYNDPSAGSQVGSTLTKEDVIVTNGLFTVQLDFGDVFDGTALYLEIGVRPGVSVGAYSPLDPRQALTASPYAIYAAKVPWSGITGMPAGFADGIDNGSAYQNILVVAKSGGDFTSIQAALNSITTASNSNHFLIYIAPGVYREQVTMKDYVDIEGAGELTTRITFTGSTLPSNGTLLGANNAELRFLTVENTGLNTYATAISNDNNSPTITHVTAITWGGTINYSIYNYSSSPAMMNVTANASGGTMSYGITNKKYSSPIMTNVTARASYANQSFGIFNDDNSSPTMTNMIATGSGGAFSYGVYNAFSSSPAMTDVTASASWGTASNYGMTNTTSCSPKMTNVTISSIGGTSSWGLYNVNSSPTMTNVTASASGATSSNYGVYNYSSSPTMTDVTASASGGTYSWGVYNGSSSPIINNSVLSASGATNNYGIYNYAVDRAFTVLVNNSQITGSTNTIFNDSEFITRIGNSQLSGGAVSPGGGTVSCIGAYDENYASPGYTTCP
jgi:hypothetical protein